MTAPSYTTDLLVVDDAEDVTSWDESTNAAWDDQGAPDDEGEYYIANVNGGAQCISAQCTKAGVGTMIADYGTDISAWDGTDCLFVWQFFGVPNALAIYTAGGQRVIIGSSRGDFRAWDTGGSDREPNPYGGWVNVVVNPEESEDDSVGSPSATVYQFFGGAMSIAAGLSRGRPFGLDVFRWGRGELIVEYGEGADNYATFAGIAAANDAVAARWGLFQEVGGSYVWKGLLSLGTNNIVDMRDSNVDIKIADTPKATADVFNAIVVTNASSRIDWSNVKFTALGTYCPGTFSSAGVDADLNWDACQFTGMNTFVFGGTNATSTNTIWTSCGAITAAGGTFTGSKVITSTVATNTSAFIWDVATDPDGYLDDMTFSKGTNAHHAIELGTSSPTTINLRGWTTTGFNAGNEEDDSTIYVARTSGTVTINVFGGNGNFTYKTAPGTATVIMNVNQVEVKIIAKDAALLTNIETARALLLADTGGDLPYQISVDIERSGSTATVTHSSHPFETDDKVLIKGAAEQEYNSVTTITVTGASTYTYTVTGTPDSPATGSPTATAVILDGDTDIDGELAIAFVYTSSQPVEGIVRRGTTTPLYKAAPLVGAIGSGGFSQTSFLVKDE